MDSRTRAAVRRALMRVYDNIPQYGPGKALELATRLMVNRHAKHVTENMLERYAQLLVGRRFADLSHEEASAVAIAAFTEMGEK